MQKRTAKRGGQRHISEQRNSLSSEEQAMVNTPVDRVTLRQSEQMAAGLPATANGLCRENWAARRCQVSAFTTPSHISRPPV